MERLPNLEIPPGPVGGVEGCSLLQCLVDRRTALQLESQKQHLLGHRACSQGKQLKMKQTQGPDSVCRCPLAALALFHPTIHSHIGPASALPAIHQSGPRGGGGTVGHIKAFPRHNAHGEGYGTVPCHLPGQAVHMERPTLCSVGHTCSERRERGPVGLSL
ncbi:unnamed protein product [Gadus morhua 'NCC']